VTARGLVREGARCREHPHRWAEAKCDRCAQPFCRECLSPTRRFEDGTRYWHCAACIRLFDEEREREARNRSLRFRAGRLIARGRRAFTLGGAAAAVLTVGTAALLLSARTFGRAQGPELPGQTATCGELTRIRSIGAIGTQGPEDTINLLTYPQRATIQVGVPGVVSTEAMVDECDTGWRSDTGIGLPLSVTLDAHKDGAYVQRVALWQEPRAPHEAWVRDFDLQFSPSEAGEDFVSVPLDRQPQLKETVEPQWFELARIAPGAIPKFFPEALPMRRMRVRVLSTYGPPGTRQAAEGVAIGEIAAYGPDLELVARNRVDPTGQEIQDAFEFLPRTISALAGRPKFVLIFNRSRSTPHIFVTTGQQENVEIEIPPGEARSVQFVAGRQGSYEFYCRVVGHPALGMVGRIEVR
jgi:plastocyanin